MSKEHNTIRCPHCKELIDVNDVLYHQLQEQIGSEFKMKEAAAQKVLHEKELALEQQKIKMAEEKAAMENAIAKSVSEKITAERIKIEQELKVQITNEKAGEMQVYMRELETKREEVKQLNKLKAENEIIKREKDELRDKITFEKEKEHTLKLHEEKAKIKQQAEEENVLKLREREKIIDDLKQQVETIKRKAEQGSMQMQGEVQELELENILRETYIYDDVNEIKKGQRGADILQTVRTRQGVECGKIYYESKRAKNFDNNWIVKLKEDNLEVKADQLVLVTETLPDGYTKFFVKDGVWICTLWEVKGLSLVLRYMMYELHTTRTALSGKESKMELLYEYLTGHEFRGQFEAIIEGFSDLQKSYMDEKMKMMKIWKEREKQFERIMTNSINFYGSLKGIAGSSIQDIEMLEGKKEKLL